MTRPDLIYTSPIKFTLKQNLLLWLVPPVVVTLLKILYATCKIEIRDRERVDSIFASEPHFLAAFWHESVGISVCFLRGTGSYTLTSYSFDGEMAARVVMRFGCCPLRGSSSRGAMKALDQLSDATEITQIVALTVDGPKGPRRVVKPGISIVSARSGFPVVPFAVTASKGWRFKSWDRFVLPKPFARILVACGDPIAPPQNKERAAIEKQRADIDEQLNSLQEKLEKEAGVDPQLD